MTFQQIYKHVRLQCELNLSVHRGGFLKKQKKLTRVKVIEKIVGEEEKGIHMLQPHK